MPYREEPGFQGQRTLFDLDFVPTVENLTSNKTLHGGLFLSRNKTAASLSTKYDIFYVLQIYFI